jgi:hypothetical protein
MHRTARDIGHIRDHADAQAAPPAFVDDQAATSGFAMNRFGLVLSALLLSRACSVPGG